MRDCYSCLANSGERPISPGCRIYEGTHWYVEHAFPTKVIGWIVIVLKRHTEALHDLSVEEFEELGQIQFASAKALNKVLNTQKEYCACFAEADHFHHIHFHIVPVSRETPKEFHGPKLLFDNGLPQIPEEHVKNICEVLKEEINGLY